MGVSTVCTCDYFSTPLPWTELRRGSIDDASLQNTLSFDHKRLLLTTNVKGLPRSNARDESYLREGGLAVNAGFATLHIPPESISLGPIKSTLAKYRGLVAERERVMAAHAGRGGRGVTTSVFAM